jgi:hypothetical protein
MNFLTNFDFGFGSMGNEEKTCLLSNGAKTEIKIG